MFLKTYRIKKQKIGTIYISYKFYLIVIIVVMEKTFNLKDISIISCKNQWNKTEIS